LYIARLPGKFIDISGGRIGRHCMLTTADPVIACLRLLIPWITSITFPIVGQVLEIILWAIVAIIAIYIIFALLSCLVGSGARLPGPFR
jgi:hypothetical protein